MRTAILLIPLLATVALARVAAREDAPAPRYAITDLGPGPNGMVSYGAALSPTGQVAGCWTMPGGHNVPNRAWIWDGKFVELWRAAPVDNSQANAVNGKNQVVGGATVRDERGTRSHAWLWEEGHSIDLSRSPDEGGGAVAINDSGEIVCTWSQWTNIGEAAGAFVWKSGHVTHLDVLAGTDHVHPIAINAAGVVAGDCSGRDPTTLAVLWRAGKPSDLGVLPGCVNSRAAAINDRGQAAGSSWGKVTLHREEHVRGRSRSVRSWTTQEGPTHAFLWENGKMTELPRLDRDAEPHGMNNRGQVVGTVSEHEGDNPRAVLWENGKIEDLNRLVPAGSGWKLRNALAINDRGQILVDAVNPKLSQALLLTPK